VVQELTTKLTAIIEVSEGSPTQVLVYFKYTVVPSSKGSIEYIVIIVGSDGSDVNQAREAADVKVPDNELL
jgi:hypothetical protein